MIIIKYLRLKHNLRHPQAGGRRWMSEVMQVVQVNNSPHSRKFFSSFMNVLTSLN